MASQVIDDLIQHIEVGQNFLLSGGAGSGKTYSLIQVLNHILSNDARAKIACITFTNVAADEIKERAPYKNLWVSTIHEFLWENIKGYQKNLKTSFVKLLTDESIESQLKIPPPDELTDEMLQNIGQIQYKEFYVLEEGVISHDHVLKLANDMFASYPLLRKILSDKFDYIFIDEYQDTQKIVIEIFLDYLQDEKIVIGLFGDSMQSIYDEGIRDLRSYIDKGAVKEVIKQDNNRCSISVIKLLNNIRKDIEQNPTNNNVKGSAKFIYSSSGTLFTAKLQRLEVFNNWDFEQSDETKQLFLTHNLIAQELDFPDLLKCYRSKTDRLLKPKSHDPLIEYLYKIHELIYAYNNRQFNVFINKTDYRISSAGDKKILNENIKRLQQAQQKTIRDVLAVAREIKLVRESDRFKDFEKDSQKKEHLENVLKVRYQQFEHVFSYINQFTPFSTQHNIKGDEFRNVFIALDNGGWSLYNFKYLFELTPNKENIIERTKKIFYVCCSRAKENLVVYFNNPSDASIQQAKVWFGEENVIKIN